MSKKIIFRADGDSNTGLGHLYRLFSLVEITKKNYDLVFITHETSTHYVIPNEYNKAIIPKTVTIKDEPNWLVVNYSPDKHIIIADGYQFTTSYQKKLKEKGYTLVYIDDLGKEHMYADVVINHSPYIQEKDYSKEPYTKLALGTQYAMLRPLFLEEAKKPKTIIEIDTAFVCFGGADPYNLTLKAVKGLLLISQFKKIHVVLGGAYAHNEIFDVEQTLAGKVKTHKNLSEQQMINVMKQCNFAIAPASTILYELSCVKMPILSGYYVENQKNIYHGLLEKETIIKGGDFKAYKISDFEKQIEQIIKSNKIDFYIENQNQLFSGNSKMNFLALLNRLSLSFRKANETDMLEVYEWSNDEIVRKNSFNSDAIELETHKKWFKNKIHCKNTLFLIALVNNKAAGVVRYELGDDKSVIGIMISKTYRGQKLASEFLRESAKEYFSTNHQPILAYIKKENLASVKAFQKAGYSFFKDEMVNGCVSFVYKLEKEDVYR